MLGGWQKKVNLLNVFDFYIIIYLLEKHVQHPTNVNKEKEAGM